METLTSHLPNSTPRLIANTSLVYISTSTNSTFSKNYSHHTIYPSCALSAHLTTDQLTTGIIYPKEHSDNTNTYFFAIENLLSTDTQVWAVVFLLTRIDQGYSVTSKDEKHLLLLDTNVRRAAVFHYCSGNCNIRLVSRKWSHSEDLLGGGVHKIVDNQNGFPPHMG